MASITRDQFDKARKTFEALTGVDALDLEEDNIPKTGRELSDTVFEAAVKTVPTSEKIKGIVGHTLKAAYRPFPV